MNNTKPSPRPRLFAFPYGGAGASCYRPWSGALPSIEVIPVQYPGRETRYNEPNIPRVEGLVEDFLSRYPTTSEAPFAFFGHSLGAVVAFEAARKLRARGLPQPVVLFVSGYPAPHLPRTRPKISHLDQEAFFAALKQDFDVTDALFDPQLASYVYPTLQADFEAVETYRLAPEAPLDVPILPLGGDQDREATPEQISAWGQHTTRPLQPRFFAGGHFYLQENQQGVIERVASALSGRSSHGPGA